MAGFYSFMNSTHAAARAQGIKIPEHAMNIGHAEFDRAAVFFWNGFAWNWHDLLLRGEWFVVAIALVSLATVFFKRFDPDTRPALRLPMPAFLRRAAHGGEETAGKWESALSRLTPLHGVSGRNRFLGIVKAELRLLLKSIPKIVYAVLALANLIALFAPETDGPGVGVLAFLWILPVLIWSQMGAREQAIYARPLIFSAPHSFLRQLPAEWVAGFLIAAGSSLGVGLRLVTRGHFAFFAVWVSGAMFIVSLAIACGTWSRGTRLFQGLYPAWWYLAMNNVPGMDFTGVTGQRHALGYFVLAGVLFASAMAQRWWNTERAAALRMFGAVRGHAPRTNTATA